jgi:molecular chaperone GrpE
MARIPIDDENELTREEDDGSGGAATDEAHAAQTPEDDNARVQSQNAGADSQRLQAERDDLYQRLARATADFKNTQKRIQGEADQRVQYANQSLIKSLLPVIDNFERALAQDAAKVDAAAILKGMQIVHDQWLSVLKQQQVNEIAPKPGEPFDPSQHEALMQQDAPQFAGKGQAVVQLLQKGYSLGDRVLRPAQVAVSRTS